MEIDKRSPAQGVVILDFGSQYTQLIARRIRELGVYAEIVPFATSAGELKAMSPKGIVLSGGPNSVFADDAPGADPAIFGMGVPVLGVCYGMQLMSQLLGGRVVPGSEREYGRAEIKLAGGSPLFAGLPDTLEVWMSHGDRVEELPAGFSPAASSPTCRFAAMEDVRRRLFALQFHPEVVHTGRGREIIANFTFGVCGCEKNWSVENWAETAVAEMRRKIGGGEVLLGLSGGVDSSVAAVLLNRAVGERLHCIYVDHGLGRLGEPEEVERMFGGVVGLDLEVVRAAPRFYDALKGLDEPEAKRKAIGRTFVDVFAGAARKYRHCRYLAQGTIYPDVIESKSPRKGPSQTIKSHHNVGGLPPDLKFELVEPLKELFKDEVRAVGRHLGLPDELLDRQPFPGPGLGVRILGEVTEEKVKILQQADLRVQQEVRKLPQYRKIWQTFAVLLPCRSVGVMGDRRTYEYTCVIRSVDSVDAMTADWTRLPYETLAAMSNRIINEVRGVNRVVYDISSKPPATIEWE
ncbi:MAG: glutamine-hydrolyzing GMP synthase [Kiritimatiellae bacterium]|nr:glutamine-hydrolyzing GMP synthase [Kiritimatiellia bacterium]